MSAAALALLLLALVIIDDKFRPSVTQRALTNPSAQLSSVAYSVRSQTRTINAMARDQIHAHPELVVFAIAGAVLVGFMLRT